MIEGVENAMKYLTNKSIIENGSINNGVVKMSMSIENENQ
jgi:hypothetical protein